jgi:hypothetical protein
MTDRKAQKRRLERAGYVHLSGWVPVENLATKRAQQHLDSYRPDADAIANEPPKPRGRPRIEKGN